MPPVGYRQRARSPSPAPSPASNRKAAPTPKRGKPTLFETADASSSHNQSKLEENRKFLDQLDDEDESSLSDADSDDFEDVPPAKRQKTVHAKAESAREEQEEDDEMDWEDAISQGPSSALKPEQEIGDVSVSVNEDGSYVEPLVSAATGKKGPSKRERQVRIQTHCLHVQALMWHNTVRNSWLNDKEVQKMLVDGLTDGVKKEVKRWKDKIQPPARSGAGERSTEGKGKAVRGKKGKQKSGGRDWDNTSEQLQPGNGVDPLLRLLKVLTAYWRKRFVVTAPGLRKQGYKPLRRLRDEIKAYEKDAKDVEEHGERVESVQAFRRMAKRCEGSRDVGAQLFVALLRGVGLETRMVANLQPAGFGWSKAEEADEKKKGKKKDEKIESLKEESDSDNEVIITSASANGKGGKEKRTKMKPPVAPKASKPARRSSRGNKGDPIDLDDSDSPLSSPPSDAENGASEAEEDGGDDISVIDVTPATPKKRPTRKYDRDLSFPTYWTEVCSPATHKLYPVDPIVLSTIASTDDLLGTFEPRGKRAEKAKQVMAYTIAFAADGTAKDVTVRYLKRHQLPGKTKGMRMPIEKIPIYNRKGKVRRYEDYDWFRTLMSVYDRPEAKRTAADDLEEQTDLKPFKPVKEEKEVAKESLQWYKQSAEYVLEQHLRREEAVVPGAEPVKTFTAGKGTNAKEHPVYLREDVVTCKTVESWHKEGRAIKVSEQPVKYVPMRAVTLPRKREMEDALRETGEKLKQGLYGQDQTDWIIPPPIENGVIPKNAFGNMDVYVPTMVPKGAVHLPLKGSAKLCRKLGIDYAEACTGFEFGKQRAVPVLTGVVVAKENTSMVRDAWKTEQEEVKRKQDTKRTATALHWWRKMLLGLRVLERMRVEYADSGKKGEEVNPFVRKARREGRDGGAAEPKDFDQDEDNMDAGAGGFFRPGHDEEEVPQARALRNVNGQDGERLEGGFAVEDDADAGGGFLVEGDLEGDAKAPPKDYAPITPVSLQSMHKAVNGPAESESGGEDVGKKPKGSTVKNKAKLVPQKNKTLQANGPVKRTPQTKSKRKVVVKSESEGEESSLSEPSESESESDDSESVVLDAEPMHSITGSTSRRTSKPLSPQVVISPEKKRAGAAVKKSTPVRSQYFKHQSEEDEDDEDDEDGESEEEIVKPRATTTRTKARR